MPSCHLQIIASAVGSFSAYCSHLTHKDDVFTATSERSISKCTFVLCLSSFIPPFQLLKLKANKTQTVRCVRNAYKPIRIEPTTEFLLHKKHLHVHRITALDSGFL